jgi:hypothetical protein
MIYRVHFYTETEGSRGYGFYSSMDKVNRAMKEFKDREKDYYPKPEIIEKIKTPFTLKEILALLNRVASHNDNG